MKKVLIIILATIALITNAQNPKITSKDSTTIYIGSNWISFKYTSDYIILNSNTDSIYSTLFGGVTASTPTTYWTLSGNNLYPNSADYYGIWGGTVPIEFFTVYGNIHSSNFSTTYGYSTIIGENSGNGSSMGSSNTTCGNYAGNAITGGYNSIFGANAGRYNTSGNYNTFMGYYSGYGNTTGGYNSFLGHRAGASNTTGNYNVYFGNYAGASNADGSYNILLGNQAGYGGLTGSNNIFIGSGSGYNNEGSSNVFIGHNSGYNESGSNKLYIENTNNASPLIYGEFDNNIVKINGDLRVGGSNGVSAIVATGDTMPTTEWVRTLVEAGGSVVTYLSEYEILSKRNDTIFGGAELTWNDTVLVVNSIGTQNILISDDNDIDMQTGGTSNTGVGSGSLKNVTTGDYNTAFGALTGVSLVTTSYNTFIGYSSGNGNQGSYNTCLGASAGSSLTGSSNTLLGYNVGQGKTWTNILAIDNSNTATPLIHGNMNADTLRVNGKLRVSGDLSYNIRHIFANFYDSYVPDLTSKIPYKLTPTFVTKEIANITFAGDTITIIDNGDYYITINVTLQGAVNEDYSFAFYKNGTDILDSCVVTTTGATNYISTSLMTYEDLVTGDDISIYINNLTNNNDATIRKMSLYIRKEHD